MFSEADLCPDLVGVLLTCFNITRLEIYLKQLEVWVGGDSRWHCMVETEQYDI